MRPEVTIRQLASAVALAVLAACGEEQKPERGHVETGGPAEQATQSVQADTTAEAIWAHLQEVDYRSNWRRWPGTGELYPGTEPHGMLLTTYVNDLAYDALANGAASMPDGAVIVKENYRPDSTFAAVTTMYRVSGYDPEHQDWFFAKHDPEGVVDVFGRAPMCQECHGSAPGGDYLFTEVGR